MLARRDRMEMNRRKAAGDKTASLSSSCPASGGASTPLPREKKTWMARTSRAMTLKEGTLHPKLSCPDLIRASRTEDRARKQIGLARAIDPQTTALPPIPFRRGTDEHFRLLATRLTVPAGE